jgi:hypothetical protein
MNVYCEFQLDRIRLKIDGEEEVFLVSPGFYSKGMLAKSGMSSRILGYVLYHQSDLNIFQRIKQRIARNRVYVLVNQDVQQYVTLRQIHEFAARFMDGGSMYIIPKPTNFDSTELERIESIRTEYIKGRQNRDTVMSQLSAMTEGRPAFK